MAKATWNGAVLAESDETVLVEGNHYFPHDAINWQYLRGNDRHTICYWKGTASYYGVVVEGKVLENAAWYYPDPSDAASVVRDRVAFWKGAAVY